MRDARQSLLKYLAVGLQPELDSVAYRAARAVVYNQGNGAQLALVEAWLGESRDDYQRRIAQVLPDSEATLLSFKAHFERPSLSTEKAQRAFIAHRFSTPNKNAFRHLYIGDDGLRAIAVELFLIRIEEAGRGDTTDFALAALGARKLKDAYPALARTAPREVRRPPSLRVPSTMGADLPLGAGQPARPVGRQPVSTPRLGVEPSLSPRSTTSSLAPGSPPYVRLSPGGSPLAQARFLTTEELKASHLEKDDGSVAGDDSEPNWDTFELPWCSQQLLEVAKKTRDALRSLKLSGRARDMSAARATDLIRLLSDSDKRMDIEQGEISRCLNFIRYALEGAERDGNLAGNWRSKQENLQKDLGRLEQLLLAQAQRCHLWRTARALQREDQRFLRDLDQCLLESWSQGVNLQQRSGEEAQARGRDLCQMVKEIYRAQQGLVETLSTRSGTRSQAYNSFYQAHRQTMGVSGERDSVSRQRRARLLRFGRSYRNRPERVLQQIGVALLNVLQGLTIVGLADGIGRYCQGRSFSWTGRSLWGGPSKTGRRLRDLDDFEGRIRSTYQLGTKEGRKRQRANLEALKHMGPIPRGL